MKRKSLITLTNQDSTDQYHFSFCVIDRGKLDHSSILTFIFSEKEEKDAGEGDRVLD